MQSKWYMRSWKSRLRHWKSTKYGTSEFALPVTSVDLGGVRENGEERAYQIARSVEPTPGSPLALGREFSSTRCTRKDVRRGGTLAWGARRCEGTGRGESPDAKEETAGTPAEEKLLSQGWRRRSSAGAASAPRRVERETRPRGTAERGDFSPMSVGRA